VRQGDVYCGSGRDLVFSLSLSFPFFSFLFFLHFSSFFLFRSFFLSFFSFALFKRAAKEEGGGASTGKGEQRGNDGPYQSAGRAKRPLGSSCALTITLRQHHRGSERKTRHRPRYPHRRERSCLLLIYIHIYISPRWQRSGSPSPFFLA